MRHPEPGAGEGDRGPGEGREIRVAARDDLLKIDKAWPAFASGGEVNIQRFRETTNEANREAMWHLFQTVVRSTCTPWSTPAT